MASSESNITKDIYTMDVGRKNGSFQSAISWIMIYWFQTFPYTSAIWKRPQDNFVKIICCLKTNQNNLAIFQSLILWNFAAARRGGVDQKDWRNC